MGELSRLIGNHLLQIGSSCRLIIEPGIVPRVRADENFRIPDLGVTCSPDLTGTIVTEPVLLIEILSPSNEAEARANIWAYTTIPSVQEILILRSRRMEAELLCRLPDGNWPDAADVLRPPAMLDLRSIAFAVPVTAFYRTAEPDVG